MGLGEKGSFFLDTLSAMLVGCPSWDVQKEVGNASLELQKEVMAGDAELGAIFIGDSWSQVAARDGQGRECWGKKRTEDRFL